MNQTDRNREAEQSSNSTEEPEPTPSASDRSEIDIDQVKMKRRISGTIFCVLVATAVGVGIYARNNEISYRADEAGVVMFLYWCSGIGALIAGFVSFLYQLVVDETLPPEDRLYKTPGQELIILIVGGPTAIFVFQHVFFYNY